MSLVLFFANETDLLYVCGLVALKNFDTCSNYSFALGRTRDDFVLRWMLFVACMGLQVT